MSAIERVLLIGANGAMQMSNPTRLWNDADTIRSEFRIAHPTNGALDKEFQLVKHIPERRAAVYREVDRSILS